MLDIKKTTLKAILFFLTVFICGKSNANGIITKIELNNSKENIISFTINKNLDYKLFNLENPKRIVIDFQNTKLSAKNLNIKSNIISDFRHAIRNNRDLRFVIEIKENKQIIRSKAYLAKKNSKYQLIVEITNSDKFKSVCKNKDKVILKDELRKISKPTIVIDPGHGGEDPGTIGRFTNTYEKNVTLQYAKTLAFLLKKSGLYNVVLTRDRDEFITLAKRVAKTKEAKADLFISLHADSHADPKMQGLSVYTLSEDSQNKKISQIKSQLESTHKQSDRNDINEILNSLIERKNKNIAIEFASSLISVMGKEVDIIKNSHRFAGFRVLRNEEVPAILIELGYLSNKQEEKLLSTEKYRTKIVNALIKAINHHFEI